MKRILTLVLLLASFGAFAQFVNGGFTPVSTAVNEQQESAITSDGTGGYVMAWRDRRKGTGSADSSDIYVQRFDGNGNMLWATNGIPACTAPNVQQLPKVVLCKTSTNQPRIMVVWQDYRAKVGTTTYTKIFCQAFDLNGNPQYATNGVEVADCNGTNNIYPDAVPALNGSRVVFAYNRRYDPDAYGNYFVQAINPDNGTTLFTGNGTRLASGIDMFSRAILLSELEGTQHIQVAWAMLGASNTPGIFAQRINPSNGSKVWAANLAIQASGYGATSFELKGDIVAWSQEKVNSQTGTDIFAQKLNADGTAAWTTQGAAVYVGPGTQSAPKISRNAFGETFITWNNLYSQGNSQYELFVQKLDPFGNRLFGTDGQLLSSNTGNRLPNVLEQPDGGTISISMTGSNQNRLLVHRLSRDGRRLWGFNGREIGSAIGGYIWNGVLPLSLSGGGAVIGFNTSFGGDNVYAGKFNFCETPPAAPAVATQYVELGATATLTATGCNGTVNWYDTNHQQGVIVGTGPTFSFTANATATYYAECVLDQCASLTTGAGQARVIIRSVQSGAWDQPATWNCNCIPEALDQVVVMPGHSVTLPTSYTAHARELRQEGTLQNSANSELRLSY
ncbi:immunoglobulin domain-containing protein [Salmonirosea aquatica]|uniref:Ig-like domain-containing protein n=1 Tax=Salmonirosea aquatica TaxID=2654236 RepID=A0A7C9FEE6_9BACT|nr:hypothetical protein [Cytophagaceae bacterium SJW1-29]